MLLFLMISAVVQTFWHFNVDHRMMATKLIAKFEFDLLAVQNSLLDIILQTYREPNSAYFTENKIRVRQERRIRTSLSGWRCCPITLPVLVSWLQFWRDGFRISRIGIVFSSPFLVFYCGWRYRVRKKKTGNQKVFPGHVPIFLKLFHTSRGLIQPNFVVCFLNFTIWARRGSITWALSVKQGSCLVLEFETPVKTKSDAFESADKCGKGKLPYNLLSIYQSVLQFSDEVSSLGGEFTTVLSRCWNA